MFRRLSVGDFADSRIVSFSSGNIYSHVPVCLRRFGRDRRTTAGRRVCDLRTRARADVRILLSHVVDSDGAVAVELRHGIARTASWSIWPSMVWNNDEIDLSMGHVNVIWQGEANAMSLQTLEHTATPPCILNIAGPEILRVREVCEELGRLLDRTPRFTGAERPEALLNNASKSYALLGRPQVTAQQMIRWTADWVRQGGASLDKPTHFGSHDGKF